MALNAESVPMRWPAGPLDIARREKEKGFSAETAEVLRHWLDPASLAVVQGTPVNCLVISWASGLPADADQQQALKPLIEKGRQAGLGFVGLIEGEANRSAAVAAAQSAGLSAVAMDGDPPGSAGIPVIPRNRAAQVRSTANSPVLSISDGLWPGFRKPRLRPAARRICPGWIPTARSSSSPGPWRPTKVCGSISIRRRRRNRRRSLRASRGRSREPRGQVGDLTGRSVARRPGSEENNGGGYVEESRRHAGLLRAAQAVQDLSAERPAGGHVEFRRSRLGCRRGSDQPASPASASRSGLLRDPGRRAPLSPACRRFSTLIASRRNPNCARNSSPSRGQAAPCSCRPTGPIPRARPRRPSRTFFSVCAPWAKAAWRCARKISPTHTIWSRTFRVIMSHRNDLLRLYNAPSMNFLYETSAQGGQGVIHLLNYSRRPGSDGPLFYVKEPHRSARLVSPEIASPAELEWLPQEAAGRSCPCRKLPCMAPSSWRNRRRRRPQ